MATVQGNILCLSSQHSNRCTNVAPSTSCLTKPRFKHDPHWLSAPHCYTCQAPAHKPLAFIQGVSTWTPRNHTGNFMAPTVQRSTHFDAAKQAPWPRMLRTPMSEQHHGLTCHITWVPNAGHQLISKLYVQAVQTGSG